MNNGLSLQKLKICTYLFSSYYSYKNSKYLTAFLKDEGNNELTEEEKRFKEEGLIDIFDEIKQGFYTTKLDSIKLLIQRYWKLNEDVYNKKISWCNNEQVENKLNNDYCEKLLYDLNKRIAEKYFYIKNGKIYIDGNSNFHKIKNDKELEFGTSHNHKFEWQILKHLIDMDTVIGVFLCENGFNHGEDMALWDAPIFTTESLLDKVLEKGVAELHMHIGASKRFTRIWMWLMNDVKCRKNDHFTKKDNILKKIKIDTIYGKIELEHYIKVAEIIRILMAAYLMYEKTGIQNFKEYVLQYIDKELEMEPNYYSFKTICDLFLSGHPFHEEKNIFYKGKVEQLKKVLNIKYEEVDTGNYNNVHENKYKEEEDNIFDYLSNTLKEDILTYIFNDYYVYDAAKQKICKKYNFNGAILPEYILISKAMEKLKDNDDDFFARIFWQYIRIKNIVYKYIVQQHTSGKGLEIFTKIYSRQSRVNINNHIEEALYSQLSNQNILKLEIRTSIGDNEYLLRKSLIDIFSAYRNVLKSCYVNESSKSFDSFKNNNIPLLVIIFHFIKTKDNIVKNKCFHSYSTKEKKDNLYYGALSEKYKKQGKLVAKLRSEIPNLSNYIVGVDAASVENDTDPFVFREAYEVLRNNENITAMARYGVTFVKDIGYTYHVGEDFRDIVSGLRHVDEVIEKLNFKSSDRLGHAVVVGIDIDKWAEINSVVHIPAGEYFENLLWEWGLYVKDEKYKNFENIAFLENRIFEMAEFIFGFTDGLTIRDLYTSYEKKFNELCNFDSMKEKRCKLKDITKKKFYIEADIEINTNSFKIDEVVWSSRLIYQALNCEYFLKGINKTVTINISRDLVNKYKKLQQYIKNKINEKGIIIETNPTSNLLIGDFATFDDYHITNLSSPEKEDVIITINTDDPVIFNTRISNEYALIYDILMRKGKHSSKEIIEWLDKIRKNSLDYSFIKDRELTGQEILSEVTGIIENLKK